MPDRRSRKTPDKSREKQADKSKNPRKRYGVIGFPVKHSASPRIHRHWGEQYNKRICYDAIEANGRNFATVSHAFFLDGGRGLNVTAPHKENAMRVASTLSERAMACGAVNLLEARKGGVMFGDNTDGAGLVQDLCVNHSLRLAGKRIAIIGAGGAARGILLPLQQLGPAQLLLASRRIASARETANSLRGGEAIEVCALRDLAGAQFDLVINATTAGFQGRVPAIPTEIRLQDSVCYDLAYGKAARPFMNYATRKGAAQALDGWGMLVEQAAESFHVWHTLRPDTSFVLANRGRFIPPGSDL